MKNSILLFFLLSFTICNGQNSASRKIDLIARIKILQDSLAKTEEKIESEKIAELDNIDHVFTIVISENSYLYSDINLFSRLKSIKDSSVIKVIDKLQQQLSNQIHPCRFF